MLHRTGCRLHRPKYLSHDQANVLTTVVSCPCERWTLWKCTLWWSHRCPLCMAGQCWLALHRNIASLQSLRMPKSKHWMAINTMWFSLERTTDMLSNPFTMYVRRMTAARTKAPASNSIKSEAHWKRSWSVKVKPFRVVCRSRKWLSPRSSSLWWSLAAVLLSPYRFIIVHTKYRAKNA